MVWYYVPGVCFKYFAYINLPSYHSNPVKQALYYPPLTHGKIEAQRLTV